VTRLIILVCHSTSNVAAINQGMDEAQRKVLNGICDKVSEAKEESGRDWLAGRKVREVYYSVHHVKRNK
jgi:hypothetical protein